MVSKCGADTLVRRFCLGPYDPVHILNHTPTLKKQAKSGGPERHARTDTGFVPHRPMCNNTHMATNLALDDRLIEEARRVGRHKTKREAVSAALAEYVKRRKQLRILDAFGTVDFDPKYDYKTERRRKQR